MNTPLLHQQRCAVIRAIRRLFDADGFVEVDTPVLYKAPAPERFIEAPAVTLAGAGPLLGEARFLQTSPELAMKQLLADGHERIYQIAACFREGDVSPAHRPEFRMLEWYRTDADWQAGMRDAEDLLVAALVAVAPSQTEQQALPLWARLLLEGAPIERVRMDEAFARFADIDLRAATDADALRRVMKQKGFHCDASDGYDELCHRVLVGVVEPALLRDERPVFLTHFPRPLGSWARTCPREPLFAERFELYVAGRELANGFTELVDAEDLQARFAKEQQERHQKGMHAYGHAAAFFARLGHMPPAVGVALGVDRLLMAVLQQSDIDAVQFVSMDRV